MIISFKRMLALTMSAFALSFAVVPAAFAGGDGGCDEEDGCGSSSSGGGSDTGSASGGAQTGFGAMATSNDDGTMSIALAGGGLLVLTLAGIASRRRETIAVDA